MKHILVIVALLLAHSAGKADTLLVHLVSYHSAGNCVNGVNPGVGYAFENGAAVGTYYNSCERQTYYAGYRTPEWNRLRLNFIAATGYFDTVSFAVFPSVRAVTVGKTDALLSGGMLDGVVVINLSLERRF